MSSSTEIRVPRETVNDDLVTISAWHRAHGERVREKDVVVSIETSKAVLEVEAASDGVLEIIHKAGAEVAIGELIGHVRAGAAQNGTAPRPATPAAATAPPAAADTGAGGAPSISRKAQKLIDEYTLDPAVFTGLGMVRESDVQAYLQKRSGAGAAPGPAAAAASDTAARPTTPPAATPLATPPVPARAEAAGRAEPYRRTGLMGDAKRAASGRGKGLAYTIWNYFWRNWVLGNLVRVSPRGVINVVHRLRGVKMGSDCFVDPSATLETAYPELITMGHDVRVTVGAIVMCHIKAPHYLQDTGLMPPVLKPVVLEDHCFIGVNAVVMPGVTVGRASVVTSGSVVVSSVPAYCMVAGNPAKVIKRFPQPGAPAADAGPAA